MDKITLDEFKKKWEGHYSINEDNIDKLISDAEEYGQSRYEEGLRAWRNPESINETFTKAGIDITPHKLPSTFTDQEESLKDYILKKAQEGKVCVMGFEGLMEMKLNDITNQPAEGILYDLNRDPATVLTFIDNPKWVNDYAVGLVIKKLKELPEAEIASQWIDFTKKKPKEFGRYLVKGASNYPITASYGFNGEQFDNEQGYPLTGVTHWLMLPKPEKEE
jgi:hypothetical protein